MKHISLLVMRLTILATLLSLVPLDRVQAHQLSLKEETGQIYIVQNDDWLSRLADKFFGDPLAWPAIWLGTNAKATEDSSFATIIDPNVIEVGQKLWIPTLTEATEYNKPVNRQPNYSEASNLLFSRRGSKIEG